MNGPMLTWQLVMLTWMALTRQMLIWQMLMWMVLTWQMLMWQTGTWQMLTSRQMQILLLAAPQRQQQQQQQLLQRSKGMGLSLHQQKWDQLRTSCLSQTLSQQQQQQQREPVMVTRVLWTQLLLR
jgi:hypothetical protein